MTEKPQILDVRANWVMGVKGKGDMFVERNFVL